MCAQASPVAQSNIIQCERRRNQSKAGHHLFYVKHFSLMLDLAIIFETAKVMLNGYGSK